MKLKSFILIAHLVSFIALVSSCNKENNNNNNNLKPCSERAVFGDPAESNYILPFSVGESYELVQSYCAANNSHRNQLAYDFLMPIGVNLIASRPGVVVELVSDQPDSEPGGQPIGNHNHVNIQHTDGSVAFYAHFKQNSIWVKVGDTVEAGDTIGLSGNSGTSTPHLHFGVYRTWPPVEGDDLAVNFRNTTDSLDAIGGLVTGEIYTAIPY